MSQFYPPPNISTHLREIHHLLGLPSERFPLRPTKILFAFPDSPVQVTCRTHLSLLDFTILTILGDANQNFLYLAQNILFHDYHLVNLRYCCISLTCAIIGTLQFFKTKLSITFCHFLMLATYVGKFNAIFFISE
jgi:hypothetical protein